ncbi:VOC family protein [Pareuzebyella sediminis]|uniref:VOC family protein n=1 Tax=Pareuzebyella sediminis TaxID=2607998 RepID=UPI0011EC0294|nr:VOC family protein [Pareuzebyella sediminis]
MASFEISNLDHVAIRVADIETSVDWYTQVLGLKKYKLEKWGDYPIFMFAGKTGIALFPANVEDPEVPDTKNVKIDHFAFYVTRDNFEKAKIKYNKLGLIYTLSDHHYFHSMYTKDPDGHTVELTTLVVPPDQFY